MNRQAMIALLLTLLAMSGISFSFPNNSRETETLTLDLHATSEKGVYEGQFNIELFNYVIYVEGRKVDASGYFSLEKFLWIELEWSDQHGENTVILDSFPPKASYSRENEKAEIRLTASVHGISVQVKIKGQSETVPTLTFCYYSPY